jgi:hypothetical protein
VPARRGNSLAPLRAVVAAFQLPAELLGAVARHRQLDLGAQRRPAVAVAASLGGIGWRFHFARFQIFHPVDQAADARHADRNVRDAGGAARWGMMTTIARCMGRQAGPVRGAGQPVERHRRISSASQRCVISRRAVLDGGEGEGAPVAG